MSEALEKLRKTDDAAGAWLRKFRETWERRVRTPIVTLEGLGRWIARWVEWVFRITLWSVLIGGLEVWAATGSGDRGGWWLFALNWLLKGYLVASSWVFSVEVVRGLAEQRWWIVGKTRRPYVVVEAGRMVWGLTMIAVFLVAAWICLGWWLPFVNEQLAGLVEAGNALQRGLRGGPR